MNATNRSKEHKNHFDVINVIERHFDDLCGLKVKAEQDIKEGNAPFSISSGAKSENPLQPGLLRLAMVGSAEKTLQGEVFYAIRKEWESKAVLEMKVSEWHDTHRNIDCVISPDFPNDLKGSTFIELGHYTTVQSKPAENVLKKIRDDFCASSCLFKSGLGQILHVMFVTQIDNITPNSVDLNRQVRDWPRLPGYFVKGWGAGSKLLKSTYRVPIKNENTLNEVHKLLSRQLKPYYIGQVKGCRETVKLGLDGLDVTGRVDRFYCYLPAGNHEAWITLKTFLKSQYEVKCGNESANH